MFPLFSDLVVSRSVRDTAGILEAVAGPTAGESTLYLFPERSFADVVGAASETLRIALSHSDWEGISAAADVARQLEKVGALLHEMGHTVVEAPPAIDFDQLYKGAFVAIPYTPLNYFTGTPAISLPLCHTEDGMPLGGTRRRGRC